MSVGWRGVPIISYRDRKLFLKEVENTEFLADDPCPIQLLRINDKSVKHTIVTRFIAIFQKVLRYVLQYIQRR